MAKGHTIATFICLHCKYLTDTIQPVSDSSIKSSVRSIFPYNEIFLVLLSVIFWFANDYFCLVKIRVCFYVSLKNYLACNLDSGFTKSLMIAFSKNICFFYGILQFILCFSSYQNPCIARFHSHRLVLFHSGCHVLVQVKHKWSVLLQANVVQFPNVLVGFVDQNIILITAHAECLTTWINA